ncbi:V-type proton ATPase subunit e 2-like [Penaeus japonicus]|uniref:V-type proton ATPase subunit e 2-like n=1 Tax=Penaeus japonicus TaxID=27405 RepID=UPI001C70B06F|nr:V-type proton ATPase subunit e 2-like [Penaeus japonicus]
MGADAIPIAVVTGFWAVVGIILPFILGKGPNKGVIQTVLVITAVTSWLFWLLCYMHQMNPLIGPQLHNTTVLAIRYLWDGTLSLDDFNETTTTNAMESTTAAAI